MITGSVVLCLLFAVPQWSVADDVPPTGNVLETPGFPDDSILDLDPHPEADGMHSTGGGQIVSCCGLEQGCGEAAYRVYVAKVLGITFANVRTSTVHAASPPPGISPVWNSPTSNNGALFTAALAGGVRVPLEIGAVRLECEGALRDNFNQASNPSNQTSIGVNASDNWSVLANAWRDVQLTRRLGAYAGGGIGGGGYAFEASGPGGLAAYNQAAVFAWQAGGGAVWRYNSLIDLDLSYRFLDLGQINATLAQPEVGSVGTLSSKMSAGELFFMLRVYEPFQWRKHLMSRRFYMPE